jgi:ribosomal protein S13
MGSFYQFLTADDIKELSQEEAETLQRVMDHELHTSDDIKRILRQRVQQVLDELKQKRGGSAP